MAFLNAWFLFRHAKEHSPSLFDFKYGLALVLLQGATQGPRFIPFPEPLLQECLPDPFPDEEEQKVRTPGKKKTRQYVATTPEEIRFDRRDHLPLLVPSKGRCKFPKMESGKQSACDMTTHCRCSKCDIPLCLVAERNHFVEFHRK